MGNEQQTNGKLCGGCYYDDPKKRAENAEDLVRAIDARDDREAEARWAAIGRRVVYLAGTACLYTLGRKHEEIVGWLDLVFK